MILTANGWYDNEAGGPPVWSLAVIQPGRKGPWHPLGLFLSLVQFSRLGNLLSIWMPSVKCEQT